MKWSDSNRADRILMHLAEIGAGRCTITDETIVAEPDADMSQVLMGLLVLHEDLAYTNRQRTEAEMQLRAMLRAARTVRERTGRGWASGCISHPRSRERMAVR